MYKNKDVSYSSFTENFSPAKGDHHVRHILQDKNVLQQMNVLRYKPLQKPCTI